MRLIAIEEVRNYEKLYASKAFLKMAGERMRTRYPTPLEQPLAMSHKNHQKSLAYFSHSAPLVSFFLLNGRVKSEGGRGMAQRTLKYAPL